MMYALIGGGTVTELIEDVADGFAVAERYHPDIVAALIEAPDGVGPGWVWDGTVFAPPPEPVPEAPVVPASISRTQMLLGLAAGGVITDAEAMAAATMGAVPAVVDAVFAQLPAEDALAARVKWAVEPTILRAHPLIAAMISGGVVTEQQADDLFVLAATR